MKNRKNALIELYKACLDKGYLDMNDDKQRLKAKVIASDLNLKYHDMPKLLEEAKAVYEQDKKENDERTAREEVENARRAVSGTLILTLSNGRETFAIFERPDQSTYGIHKGVEKKIENYSLGVERGGYVDYQYKPAEVVYTGATVGGVTTGGTHVNEAHYTQKSVNSNKGQIVVTWDNTSMTVKEVEFDEVIHQKFRRDKQFKELVPYKRMICYDTKAAELTRSMQHAIANSDKGYYDKLGMMSYSIDRERLPYQTCKSQLNLINRVLTHQYPPSDEEYYEKALSLANASNSAELLKAAETFALISDYKDSAEKEKELRQKYEEVLQEEKERKILEEEKRLEERQQEIEKLKSQGKQALKVGKVVVCIGLIIAIIGAIAYFAVTKVVIPNKNYNDAVALMESGSYDEAISAFEAMDGYKDSSEKIKECEEGIQELKKQKYESIVNSVLQNTGDPQELDTIPREFFEGNDNLCFELANNLFEKEDYLRAIKYYELCEAANDVEVPLSYAKAKKAISYNNWDEAIKCLLACNHLKDADSLLVEAYYSKVKTADKLSLESAIEILEPIAGESEEIAEFCENCKALLACSGTYKNAKFVYPKDGSTKETDAVFEMTLYVEKGKFCADFKDYVYDWYKGRPVVESTDPNYKYMISPFGAESARYFDEHNVYCDAGNIYRYYSK